jgi:hypothetical protein
LWGGGGGGGGGRPGARLVGKTEVSSAPVAWPWGWDGGAHRGQAWGSVKGICGSSKWMDKRTPDA